ncbi:MAG: phosphotransferase [Phycisphaeraceae bacterium]|nr:phosphotransferase [Phycisphaeraceae bacterium]
MVAQPSPGDSDTHHAHHADAHPAQGNGSGDLAALLEPALRAACRDRLSGIQWFKSTWQAGGASTGFAEFSDPDGGGVPVVVKLPVGPAEYVWTTGVAEHASALGGDQPERHLPTPRVFASGQELGGYDLAWIVVERLEGQPLNHGLSEAGVLDLLRAAARWYLLSSRIKPPGKPPPQPDWEAVLHKAREALKQAQGPHGTHAIENPQHWNAVLKDVHRALPRLTVIWDSRPINSWCHGDLHPGNAMRRAAAGNGHAAAGNGDSPCVLLDLALVHAGHWVEDACYLERLYWGKPEMLHGVKPVTALNKFRKELGMHHGPEEDHQLLANVRRVLMAATAPAYLQREGHPRYIKTALETLERLLPLIPRH